MFRSKINITFGGLLALFLGYNLMSLLHQEYDKVGRIAFFVFAIVICSGINSWRDKKAENGDA